MNSDRFEPALPQSFLSKVKKIIFGPAKNLKDPSVGHKLSLVALLAWVGLGADGLSSSAYGPEEAYRTLGQHTYLAIFLVVVTAATVFIISYAYSRIIEHFPTGGRRLRGRDRIAWQIGRCHFRLRFNCRLHFDNHGFNCWRR